MYMNDPKRYLLILMDVHMPDMDGMAATKLIRSMNFENSRSIPIIALTASISKTETEPCYIAGMNEIAPKPIPYDDLIDLMLKYC